MLAAPQLDPAMRVLWPIRIRHGCTRCGSDLWVRRRDRSTYCDWCGRITPYPWSVICEVLR